MLRDRHGTALAELSQAAQQPVSRVRQSEDSPWSLFTSLPRVMDTKVMLKLTTP